jgi:hypothetical protein
MVGTGSTTGSFGVQNEFSYYATTAISLSTVYDLCMVYNGTSVTPYINGVAQSAQNLGSQVTFSASAAPVYLANGAWSGYLSEEILVNSVPASLASNFHTYAEAKWGPY